MASAKELKDRIKAVKETKKITGAMYLISSTKLRRAKQDLAGARPYFDALEGEMQRILRVSDACRSRYHRRADGAAREGVRGVLAITADKGLAGAYNLNVIRETERLLAEAGQGKLFVVGEYGRRYFAAHRGDATYLGGAHAPAMDEVRALGGELLSHYDGGELSELYVVYTDMKNSLASTVLSRRLLPLERLEHAGAEDEDETARETRFEFIPSEDEVALMAARSYVNGFLYGALLDSFCAEQNARVAAMDAANTNAQELLGDLSLQLNRTRQAAITREITEISAGAQAQKNKKGGERA